MYDWQKNRNFREREDTDGNVRFVITVDGEDVEVSEEIFREYAIGAWKMENTELKPKRNRALQDKNGKVVRDADGQPIMLPECEVSLDRLKDEDLDFPTDELSPEEDVLRRMEINDLYRCLDLLRPDERALVDALFFSNDGKGMPERKYSALSGTPQKTINNRCRAIRAKLKKYLRR